MVPTVSVPPRFGVPVPTPGLEPLEVPPAPVVVELDEPDEQAARPVAPRATAPPATAPRVRNVLRSNPLPDVTDIPHLFSPYPHRTATVAPTDALWHRRSEQWGQVTAKYGQGPRNTRICPGRRPLGTMPPMDAASPGSASVVGSDTEVEVGGSADGAEPTRSDSGEPAAHVPDPDPSWTPRPTIGPTIGRRRRPPQEGRACAGRSGRDRSRGRPLGWPHPHRPRDPEGPPFAPTTRLVLAVVVAVVLVAAVVLRFWTRSDLWLDEALTVDIARQPLHDIPSHLRMDGAPPLFYVLLHFWMRIFGSSDYAVRALPG